MIKPVALPRPPRAAMAARVALESAISPEVSLDGLLLRREAAALHLGLLDAEIEQMAFETQCGSRDDTQDVERYDGTLGVPRDFVDQHEAAVGQLQWLDDLPDRFRGPGQRPGDVAGARWGSGGLIADDLFLTAGHCFDQSGGGWERPSRDGRIIGPEEIATLMRVNFNFQIDGQSGQIRSGIPFPVEALVEYRLGGVDFALVRLGCGPDGRLPGERFGILRVAARDLATAKAMLCVIQHPNGRPKQVEAGPMFENRGGQITYDSIDTLGGSSGAPVLSEAGEIVGVHTNGGCTAFSGFNIGQAIGAVRQASKILA